MPNPYGGAKTQTALGRGAPIAAALAFIAAALGACGGAQDGVPPAEVDGSLVALGDQVAIAPDAWRRRQPRNSMRLAEFTLPPDPGATDTAEVVVYFFGAGQGGDVEANVERWRMQFTDEDGSHPDPAVEPVADAFHPTTLVEMSGRYARGMGMGSSPEDARADQVLLAAVVEAPAGNLYVQMYGPSAVVRAQRDAFVRFVRGIRPHPETD